MNFVVAYRKAGGAWRIHAKFLCKQQAMDAYRGLSDQEQNITHACVVHCEPGKPHTYIEVRGEHAFASTDHDEERENSTCFE